MKKSIPAGKKVAKPTRPPVVIEHPIQVLPSKHKSHNSKLTMGLPEFSKSGELQTSSSKKCKNFQYFHMQLLSMKFLSLKAPTDPNDDGDEPYTPFDDDEESFSSSNYNSAPTTTAQSRPNEDLESQMEVLNRQIAQRQLEIQSLAQQKVLELNEEQATRIYEKITVPHDLSDILSKISNKQASDVQSMDVDDDDDEYVPTPMSGNDYRAGASYSAGMSQPAPIVNAMMDIDERVSLFQAQTQSNDDKPSRLATMTEADLMKLVPDGALQAPPAPNISEASPAIPGLEDDYEMN